MPELVVSGWYLVVGGWFVVNSGWVKNVNNLRKISGILCVHPSTVTLDSPYSHTIKCVQCQLHKLHLLHNSTNIYTYIIYKFYLLNKSFTHYPQHLLINPLNEI